MRATGIIGNGVALLALAAAFTHGCGSGRVASPLPSSAVTGAEAAPDGASESVGAAEPPAQASAEVASEENRGPGRDEALFEARCRLGEPEECYEAGYRRIVNDDEDDDERAIPFFLRACELGVADGCGEAAELLDVDDVAAFYGRFCAPGRAHICTEWAYLLLEERDVNDPEVWHAFRWACELGDVEACVQAADRLDAAPNPTAERDAIALELLRRACELDDSNCEAMGDEHLFAFRTDYDPELAVEYYRRACATWRPAGCYALGRVLVEGVVTPADPVEGERLLALACEQGNHPTACMLQRALAALPPTPAETRRACGSARRLALGQSVEGRTGPIRGFASRCGSGAASPDQAYELRIARPMRVRLALSANFDAVLQVRRACDAAPEAELACNNDSVLEGGLNPFYSLLELDLRPGTYFVVVDGVGDEAEGTFRLVTQAVDPPR